MASPYNRYGAWSHKSTPLWPSQAECSSRRVDYLSYIANSARASIRDFILMNELFLTMFRGVIDVGLPYYLFVWSSRNLPTYRCESGDDSVYAWGGLVATLFNALEKLAICQWSMPI